MFYEPLVQRWYGLRFVQYQMFFPLEKRYLTLRKLVKDKEGKVVLGKNGKEQWVMIRNNKVTSVEVLMRQFQCWKVGDRHKAYMDITQWKEMPLFEYGKGRKIQKEQFKEKFEKEWEDMIQEFDFLIDIDAEKDAQDNKMDWKSTHARALKCAAWLKRQKMPYAVWNSSDNGFQFWVPGSFFSRFKSFQRKSEKYIQLAGSMRGVKPDESVYDLRRVCKLPYSLCEGKVVLPLSDEQLALWSPEMVEPQWVLDNVKIYNRGWLFRGLS